MEIDIYRHTLKRGYYAALAKGSPAPQGTWAFVRSLTIAANGKRIGIDEAQAISDIQAAGVHAWKVDITFTQKP